MVRVFGSSISLVTDFREESSSANQTRSSASSMFSGTSSPLTSNVWNQLSFMSRLSAVLVSAWGLFSASDPSIFLSDYDAPFLEAQLPEELPPDVEGDTDDDDQTDLSAFYF